MNLLHCLPLPPARRPARPPRRPPAPLALATERPAELPGAPPDERPPGCGWFDSSHELQTGLHVTEHDEVAAVVHQIPLSWWLGWELDAALASVR